MTDEPEVAAYQRPSDEDVIKVGNMSEYRSDYTLPLIRLTDHEASRAADKARIAGLEADLSQANQRAGLWKSNYADANERIDELLGLLRECIDCFRSSRIAMVATYKTQELSPECNSSLRTEVARLDSMLATLERHKC